MTTKTMLCGLLLVASLAASGIAGAQGTMAPDNPRKADPMTFARGANKWAGNCQRCHAVRDPKEFDDAEWHVVMTHMRVRAGLTGQDAAEIRAFLQQSN